METAALTMTNTMRRAADLCQGDSCNDSEFNTAMLSDIESDIDTSAARIWTHLRRANIVNDNCQIGKPGDGVSAGCSSLDNVSTISSGASGKPRVGGIYDQNTQGFFATTVYMFSDGMAKSAMNIIPLRGHVFRPVC